MQAFTTKGVCSQKIDFKIENGIIKSVAFTKGCSGNLQAIAVLVEGMPVNEVIKRLKGIICGERGTSCADQLAVALQGSC